MNVLKSGQKDTEESIMVCSIALGNGMNPSTPLNGCEIKVSSQSRKSEFRVFSIVPLNIDNF